VSTDFCLIVCTRNRPADLERALPSLIQNIAALDELCIVDQSDDDRTERLVAELAAGEPKLRYVRAAPRGLSYARNRGICETRASLVGFTDDDCLLPADWVEQLRQRFAAEPRLGAIFGPVEAVEHDRCLGWIPVFQPPATCTIGLRGVAVFSWVRGLMGANMAFRRVVLEAIGGFDPLLGAGAPLKSAEDIDAAFRAARCGWTVAIVRQPVVLHFGYRAFEGGASRQAIRAGVFGAGGYYGKHVRCGDWLAAWLLGRELAIASAGVVLNAARGRRPLGWSGLSMLVAGVREAFRFGLDRRKRVFTVACRQAKQT
jgi:glycosyltransferase involved in cell wall biosynthesis